jgi:diguanylate cyclase (GGDEF)-like protein
MLYRLRHDFQLSIITLLGICAVLGVSPFVVYRFATGDPLAGATDLLIVSAIAGIVVYAWITGNNHRAGLLLAIITCTGGVAVATIVGSAAVFWLFPATITSFFLTPPRVACTVNGLAIATLAIHNTAFDSSEQMLSFVATSLTVSACAFIFARRNEYQRLRLERLATHDALTGTKNRRALEEDMQAAVADHQRSKAHYALILLDLDHFKRVNDRFGHGVGDSVLVDCAELLGRYTRLSDNLYRFGGEEFVLILPGVEPASVSGVADNLRLKLANELSAFGTPVTGSIGVASLQSNDSVDSWLERADTALYAAKSAGRNTVIIAEYPNHAMSVPTESETTESPA